MNQQIITASQEDYIEAIYAISSRRMVARVKDIAEHMRVHKSTVSATLHQLAQRKLVNYAPYEAVTLTTEGQRIGANVMRRHETLTRFLVNVLSVEPTIAEETACKMEHVIPSEVIDRFTGFADFFENCPNAGAHWEKGKGYYCSRTIGEVKCQLCQGRNSNPTNQSSS
jgi:DtxR family transcriptional regulator, Mn-dependent transcriptional regulator